MAPSYITQIDQLQSNNEISVGGASQSPSTLYMKNNELQFLDASGNTSTYTQDGYVLNMAQLVGLPNQINLSANRASPSLQILPNSVLATELTDRDLSIRNPSGDNVVLSNSSQQLVFSPGTGGTATFNTDGMNILTFAGTVQVSASTQSLSFAPSSGNTGLFNADGFNCTDLSGNNIQSSISSSQINITTASQQVASYGNSVILYNLGNQTSYTKSQILSDTSFDLTSVGLTFGGLAGTSSQVLTSQGAGTMPIWTNQIVYVNPLLIFNSVFTPATSGTVTFASLGDTRTFTVSPLVMLQGIDATNIIPIMLTATSTTDFSWISSSNLGEFNVSVYSLG